MSISNAGVSSDEQAKLVAVMVRFTPATHAALKAESQATAVPVSILVRQLVSGWFARRSSTESP